MEDDKDRESLPGTPSAQKRSKDYANNTALALELPFTLVGAVIFAGFLGYLLDRWLHTKPILMLICGGLGVVGGIREVLRRLPTN